MKKHIVLITDDNYVMPTIITIRSLIDACKDSIADYCIHICTLGVSNENHKIFNNLKNYCSDINIHDVHKEAYSKRFNQINQNSHVTPSALIKFELANILSDIDTVLYLDSDIIVRKALDNLFDLPIDSYYAAASYEFWCYLLEQYKFNKNFAAPDFYFNSGVMLLNLKKIREDNISEKLWNLKLNKYNNKSNKKFAVMDQDVLNEAFYGNVYPISIIYNCNCKFTKNVDINAINMIYSTNYKSLTDMLNDVVIVHYVGKEDKPWLYENANCVELWDNIYKKSDFAYVELNRKIFKKGVRHYINALKTSILNRGFIKTIKYIFLKLK